MARLLLRTAGGVTALLLLACVILVFDGLTDEIAPADVGVVLGNTVERDGRPSPRLAARLQQALVLYRRGLYPAIIVSGGTGQEGFDEAEVMKAWLVARGVPAEAVLVDSQGVTTAATARNAVAIMKARGMNSALVVTQYFHVPRARLALQKAGVRVTGASHARHFEWRDLYSIPRELAGYTAYLVR